MGNPVYKLCSSSSFPGVLLGASYPLGPAIPLHPPQQHGVEPRETAALCKLLGLVLVA